MSGYTPNVNLDQFHDQILHRHFWGLLLFCEGEASLQFYEVVPKLITLFLGIPESPGPPTFSLHPHYPMYVQGEEITLFCLTPKEVESRGYIFYQAIGGKVLRSLPENHHATFRVEEGTVGMYSCVYWVLVSGRKIQSQWSKSIYVNRTGEPVTIFCFLRLPGSAFL